MTRTILHCDLNSFYASVELLSHPELADRPVAVCGDPESRHGIILAKNEPAKAAGVKTAQTIWQAQRSCPDLILLPAHRGEYLRYSKLVNGIYERYTDLVEPFGIDESWLDVTGSMQLFGGSGRAVADQLRAVIKEELGLTISVGVSFNKVFAKLGSDMKKPDATTVITRENFRAMVWPLPVTDLLFVGRSSAQALGKYGVRTIGDLARTDQAALTALLGKAGGQLWEYANGLERSPVAPAGAYTPPKSIGNGETFPRDLVGAEALGQGLRPLAESVAARLRRHHMKCTALQLTIRDPRFRDLCRQRPLSAPTCTALDLHRAAQAILADCWPADAPVRALTLTALALVPEDQAAEQLSLFAPADCLRRDRRERVERTCDELRARFGPGCVR